MRHHNREEGLRCPSCTSIDLAVKDSRPKHGSCLRRRYCNECGEKFTTAEMVLTEKRGKAFNIPEIVQKAIDFQALKRDLSDRLLAVVESIQ